MTQVGRSECFQAVKTQRACRRQEDAAAAHPHPSHRPNCLQLCSPRTRGTRCLANDAPNRKALKLGKFLGVLNKIIKQQPPLTTRLGVLTAIANTSSCTYYFAEQLVWCVPNATPYFRRKSSPLP